MEYKNFFHSESFRKILALLLLLGIIISLKPMMNLLLLTFMFSFILYGIQNYLFHKIIKLIPVNRTAITYTIFTILASAIVFFVYKYVPILTKQLIFIGNQLSNFDINSYENAISPQIREAISSNIQSYIVGGGTTLFIQLRIFGNLV